MTFWLPILFSYFACRTPTSPSSPSDDDWAPWLQDDDDDGGGEDEFVDDFGSRFNCGVNQTNELASVFFGSREEAIKNILRDPQTFDERTLLVVGFLFLPLLLLTFGTHIPCGLFMPTILIGGSLGGYSGIIIERHFMPGVSPATFALVGATALLGGIQRSTVSLCVIIMEGTGETKFLIPIVITTVVSKWVGDHFTEGIYEIGMELKGYPYLDHHIHKAWDQGEVGEVMTREVVSVGTRCTAGEIEEILNNTTHNGFPRSTSDNDWAEFYSSSGSGIVPVRSASDDTNGGPSKFVGLRRNNLSFVSEPVTAALAVGNDCKFAGGPRPPPPSPPRGRDSAHRQSLLLDTVYVIKDDLRVDSERLPTVKVAEGDLGRLVNVGGVMNVAPHTVKPNTPLSRAYRLFTNMGLRHLTVVDGGGRVAGMVTRKDILKEKMKTH
ncbi:hypothetical protein TrRE_jg7992 [Triparma retinervis]|uniref:Chloride channel protein n=1 Tax=Triparma retinervis TaxID=2557542 RepID=A0A9W7FWJ9_9STRA|nr:hypothetical protein TrRE_jg7992 [Triparma retinervis]